MTEQKVAFVYDWFDTGIGGAERVIQVLHDLYPDAPWYTLHVDFDSCPWAKGWNLRASFLQKFPLWFRRNRILTLPLMPLAFESFDFSSYEMVISVSSGFAKNVITTANTKHICYLLTPPRWLYKFQIPNSKFQIINKIQNQITNYFMCWDKIGAKRVDEYISISQEVAKRCKEFYGRESEVIYPPFDFDKWKVLSSTFHIPSKKIKIEENLEFGTRNLELYPKSYFLVVSRLKKYKRVDLMIEAFARFQLSAVSCQSKDKTLKIPYPHFARGFARAKQVRNDISKEKLVIVGTGEEEKKLRALVSKLDIEGDVVWLNNLSDKELACLYKNAIALVMPQEEDLGYTACEASACKCPVIVFAKGGQTEIIKDKIDGLYFHEQSASELAATLEEILKFGYNQGSYENSNIRGWSRHSFVATFSQKITKTV